MCEPVSISAALRGHDARPMPGTARSVRSGEPCKLLDQAAYPVAARCAECGMPVTAVSFFAAFYHDDRQGGGS